MHLRIGHREPERAEFARHLAQTPNHPLHKPVAPIHERGRARRRMTREPADADAVTASMAPASAALLGLGGIAAIRVADKSPGFHRKQGPRT